MTILPAIISGANMTLAKGQDEYTTLHGRYEMIPLGPNNPELVPSIAVAFSVELADITKLLAGGTLVYRCLGTSFAPMVLYVEEAAEPIDMSTAG